jgi:hypothetical protein
MVDAQLLDRLLEERIGRGGGARRDHLGGPDTSVELGKVGGQVASGRTAEPERAGRVEVAHQRAQALLIETRDSRDQSNMAEIRGAAVVMLPTWSTGRPLARLMRRTVWLTGR